MQQFSEETEKAALDRCAALVLDVGLFVSRFARSELWRQHPDSLSMEQFRGLVFVNAFPDASPSALADYLLLTRPAVTRLVDELVERKLMTRKTDPDDRRRLTLGLTAAGRRQLDTHFTILRGLVAERLASLGDADLASVSAAMEIVRPRFQTRVPDAPDAARE